MTTRQIICMHPINYINGGVDLIKLCKAMLDKECYVMGCKMNSISKGNLHMTDMILNTTSLFWGMMMKKEFLNRLDIWRI